MNIFICSCVEERYPDIRVDYSISRVLSWDFDRRYIKVFSNDDLYIICPEIVNFCYLVNRWYFFGKTCAFNSRDNLFSCITNLKFGFKSICPICLKPLARKLFQNLSKI